MEELEQKIEALEEKIDDLKEKVSDLEDDLRRKEYECENLEWDIEDLEDEINGIKENWIEWKLIEIFQDYNSIWDDSIKDQKLIEKIMDIKRDLHY